MIAGIMVNSAGGKLFLDGSEIWSKKYIDPKKITSRIIARIIIPRINLNDDRFLFFFIGFLLVYFDNPLSKGIYLMFSRINLMSRKIVIWNIRHNNLKSTW